MTIYQSPAPAAQNNAFFRATMTSEDGVAIDMTIARFMGVGVWTAYGQFLGSSLVVNVIDLNADFTRHSPIVAMDSAVDGTMPDAPTALYLEGFGLAIEQARLATFTTAAGLDAGVSVDETRPWDKAEGFWVFTACRVS
ncbi:hypothetical protein [Mesorhizobium sp.]|uniref:hypothetical protein n=1 Tax=Mesorhizobium sp. TaxID=1871066 RepID=UPI000FEA7894|nr:hypothetical protein [Mesorhizobium sp.]RWD77483.1 MAG: hypothetical protein EOS48_29360 [Mesorhizobium sp.]